MDLIIKLGEIIRGLRKQKGYSQEKLGELSNIHTNYIGAIERGEKNLTIESLIKVTQALDITLEELFQNLDPRTKESDFTKIKGLLSNRPREDHELAYKIIKDVFDWEKNKIK